MEQRLKRFKPTKELIIADYAASIDHIAESVKSISQSYGNILRVNIAVVRYLQKVEKREKVDLARTIGSLERTSVGEKE